MNEDLIAPCGMNCSLCVNYQFREKDLNRLGFHKTYCPGCIPRGKNCTFMAGSCDLIGKEQIRFCHMCGDYPCRRLKDLDKRYRTKYHMSMVGNLDSIKAHGMENFLREQEEKWRCPTCGGTVCCHNGLCLECNIDTLHRDKKYRWGEDTSVSQ